MAIKPITIPVPVPWLVTTLKTLAAVETMLGELAEIHSHAGGIELGTTTLTSGVTCALLDAGIDPETGYPLTK
jgi:hypothetical protein